jgi:cell division septation protein DedD
VLSDQVPYFILDLLQQTPKVYVKGLGRFEAIFHPAVMDVPGSRIKPPYIQPEFNEQEPEEDALLATYIHYVLGTERGEIDQAIGAFVNQVKDHIDRNDHYTIDQFGSFSKNIAGGLRFTPDWDAFNLSFKGLEIIDLHPPAEPVESRHYVAEPYVPPPPVAPIFVVEEVKPVKEEPVPVSHTPEFVPVHVRDTSAIDQTTSRLWWTILASALVLITVLCAYLAWDILSSRQKLSDLVVIRPDTTSKTIVLPTPPVIDTAQTQENPVTNTDTEKVTTPVTEPQENQVPDESACYIVVGAFKDADNIAKMEERVTSMGYTVEKIAGGNLTRVAIKSSCDKAVLQQTLNDVRAKLNPEAWLY